MSVALFASRLAPEGIGVFEIRPGIIRTDMISKAEKVLDEDKIAAGLLHSAGWENPPMSLEAVGASPRDSWITVPVKYWTLMEASTSGRFRFVCARLASYCLPR